MYGTIFSYKQMFHLSLRIIYLVVNKLHSYQILSNAVKYAVMCMGAQPPTIKQIKPETKGLNTKKRDQGSRH